MEEKKLAEEAIGKEDVGKKNHAEVRKNAMPSRLGQMLEEYDFRNEKHILGIGKWALYILLLFLELLILLQHLESLIESEDWVTFCAFLMAGTTLTASETISFFLVKEEKDKRIFYILEAVAVCGVMIFTEGTYPLLLTLLVLTEFYFATDRPRTSVWIFMAAVPLLAASYILQVRLRSDGEIFFVEIFRESLGSLASILLHFFAVQLVLAFYRQYLKLNRTLEELDESKRELEKAYAAVAEVSALEERQRIAKDIHDMAGHSMTTVIMQTEAAKRIIETSPDEAKTKIIAANLQAKHALEELRNSVHLLSGSTGGRSLKTALENIIHESTDGTGIHIRSKIASINASQAKYRFLCNTLKEGISNGLRHGGATAFWFELKSEDGKIYFLLSDNGKGIAIDMLQAGFGLTSMKDRARALGGEVSFTSEPDEGFELCLTLPVDTEE